MTPAEEIAALRLAADICERHGEHLRHGTASRHMLTLLRGLADRIHEETRKRTPQEIIDLAEYTRLQWCRAYANAVGVIDTSPDEPVCVLLTGSSAAMNGPWLVWKDGRHERPESVAAR